MAHAEELARETASLSLQQAIASGTMAVPAGCVLVGLVSPELGYGRAAAWAGAIAAYLLWRNRLLSRSLARVSGGERPGHALFMSTMGLGLLLGGFAAFAIGAVGYESRLLLTLLLCCWFAAAVLSSGFSSLLYGCYLACGLGGLAAGWTATQDAAGVPIAAALVLYGVVLWIFSLNFSRRIAEGIAIRSQNAELVRQLAAANEAKTRFLMAASHDLRQPLHAIGLMGAGLLRLTDPAEIRSLSQTLALSVQNLNQLFSSVLDISRIDSGEVRPTLSVFSLDTLVAQLDAEYRALCLAQDRRWECRVESVVVRSDPAQLERLLRNLLDNAIKHGGMGAIRLSVARQGHEAVVTVADTGPGIRPEERERVFDEFYRATGAGAGLGLGLSIVRRLSSMLGARLELDWTDSQRRLGTRVEVHLPAGELGAPIPPVHEPAVDLTGIAVLVLDDDPTIRKATEALLRSWDCRVVACADAGELPQAVRELGSPDVAIIDDQLAGGVLGTDAIAMTQQRFPEMSTLIVTGESEPGRLEALKDLGFVLRKPLAPDALRRALAGIRSASA